MRTERQLLVGLLCLLGSIPPHFYLHHIHSVQLAALTLALIGGAYIGFAAADGRLSALLAEGESKFQVAVKGCSVPKLTGFGAQIFLLAAWAGLNGHLKALGLGVLGHAVWDLLHHGRSSFGANTPQWYVNVCIAVDIPLGLFFLWLFQ